MNVVIDVERSKDLFVPQGEEGSHCCLGLMCWVDVGQPFANFQKGTARLDFEKRCVKWHRSSRLGRTEERFHGAAGGYSYSSHFRCLRIVAM